MDKLKEEEKYSKYLRIKPPIENEISRDSVFFRNKYQEVINYVNVIMVSDDEELVKRYVYPKGILLINIGLGTDIHELLRFIAKNYNMNLVEFDYEEISKNVKNFQSNFNQIIESYLTLNNSKKKNENNSNYSNKIKNLIIIESEPELKLLKDFLLHFLKKPINYSFLDYDSILIWVNHEINEIKVNSTSIFELFDLFVRISSLTPKERFTFFTGISEKYPKIVFDIGKMVELTDQWEVKDLNQLLRLGIFKQYLNSDLNDISNEITNILEDLIESEEYIPAINKSIKKELRKIQNESITDSEFEARSDISTEEVLMHIKTQKESEFLLKQLYEEAASENYAELMIILEKLVEKETLEENELKMLSRYPFVLKNPPKKAQIYLEKAKKRIDQIRQVFGFKS